MNSKLFHKSINARHLSSWISHLNLEGVWIEEPAWVKRAISGYFRLQIQKEASVPVEFPSALITAKLDEADGTHLIKPFTEDEIRLAI